MGKKKIIKYNEQANIIENMYKTWLDIGKVYYEINKESYDKAKVYGNKAILESIKDNQLDILNKGKMFNLLNFEGVSNIKQVSNSITVKGFNENKFFEGLNKKYRYLGEDNTEVKKTLKDMDDFYTEYIDYDDVITEKSQSPNKFLSKVISYDKKLNHRYTTNKTSTTTEQILTSLENYEKANNVVIFDLETFAGANELGVKTFGGITEYAFGVYDKAEDGSLSLNKAHTSIVGISSSQTEKYIKDIENYLSKKETKVKKPSQILAGMPDDVRVAMIALGKMGSDKTSIIEDENTPGLFRFESYATDDTSDIFSIDAIKKGAEIYDEIHRKQMSSIGSAGIPTVEQDFIEGVAKLKNNVYMGYNIDNADIPWLEQSLYKLSPEGQEYARSLLGGELALDPSKENMVDVMSYVQKYDSTHKRNALDLYNDRSVLDNYKGGFVTSKQQESLARGVLSKKIDEGMSAHSALDDVQMLALLMSDEGFYSDLKEGITADDGKDFTKRLEKDNMLFMTTQTDSFGKFYKQGGISFSYNAEDKTKKNMFGINFLKDGKARVEFNDFGRKKDTLVKINQLGKVELTDEFREELGTKFSDYAQSHMYFVDIGQVTSKEEIDKRTKDNTVLFFNTESSLEEYLSSLRHVASRDEDGTMKLLSGDEGYYVRRDYSMVTGRRTKEKINSVEDLINFSNARIESTTGVRYLSNMTYGKTVRFNEAYNSIKTTLGKEEVTKEDFGKILEIASDVSEGKVVGNIGQDDIIQMFGFGYKDKTLYKETLGNISNTWDYQKAMMPVTDRIIEYIDKSGRYKTDVEKNLAFEKILKATQSEIISQQGRSETFVNTIKGKGNLRELAKNMNVIDLDASKLIGRDGKVEFVDGFEKSKNDLIRIDLTNKNASYKLVNDIMRITGDSSRATDYSKNITAMSHMKRLIEQVSSNEDYSEYVQMDKYFKEDPNLGLVPIINNPNELASIFIDDLKEAKERSYNPFFGVVDYSNFLHSLPGEHQISVLEEAVKSVDNLDKLVANAATKVGDIRDGLNRNAVDIAKDITKDQLLGGKSSKEIASGLRKHGYDEESINHIKRNVEDSYRTMVDNLAKIISSGSKVGIDFEYADGYVKASIGGEEAILSNLPKISELRGTLATNVGGNDYSFHSVVKARNMLDGKMSTNDQYFDVVSTISDAFESVYNPYRSFESIKHDPSEVISRLKMYDKNLGEVLRSESAIQELNSKERSRMLNVDINEFARSLPKLYKQGVLEGAPIRSKEFKDLILENEDILNRNLTPDELEALSVDLPGVIQFLSEKKTGLVRTQSAKSFFQNANFNTSEKELSQNVVKFGFGAIAPGVDGSNNIQRPVPWQTASSHEFRRSMYDRVADKYKDEDWSFKIGDIFEVDTFNKTKGITKGYMKDTLERSMTVRKLNADSSAMTYIKKSIEEDYLIRNQKEGISGLTKTQRKMMQYLGQANTHEDAYIAGRVIYDLYGYSEDQIINLRGKELAFDLGNEHLTKENLDMVEAYMPKLTMNENGSVDFKYADPLLMNKEDVILREKSFSGDYTPYGLKHEMGLVNMRFMDPETKKVLEEEEVQEFLNDVLLEEPELSEGQVLNKLRDKFDPIIVSKDAQRKEFNKIFMNAGEKGMARYLVSPIGGLDDDLKEYFETNLQDTDAYKFLGKIPTEEAIDQVILENFVSTEKYKTKEELKKAILDEQYGPMDELFGQFFNNEFQIIGQGSPNHKNYLDNQEKMIGTVATQLAREKNISMGEALSIVVEELDEKGIIDIEDVRFDGSTIVLPSQFKEGDHIKIDRMKEYVMSKGMFYEDVDEDGNVITRYGLRDEKTGAAITTVGVAKSNDLDQPSYSRMTGTSGPQIDRLRRQIKEELDKKDADHNKIRYWKSKIEEQKKVRRFFDRPARTDGRELNLLRLRKVDDTVAQTFMEQVEKGNMTIDDLKRVAGHMFEIDDEQGIVGVKEEYQGKPILKENVERLKYSSFNRYAGKSLEKAIEDGGYDHLRPLQAELEKRGINADLKSAIEFDELAHAEMSASFNSGTGLSLDRMQELGFQITNVEDMAVPLRGDAEMMRSSEMSYLTNNMVLDLGEEFEDDGKRYLAIPKIDRTTGEEVVKYEHQKSLINLKRSYHEYQDALRVGDDEEAIEHYKDKLMSAYDMVEADLRVDIDKKGGMFSEFIRSSTSGSIMAKSDSIVELDFNKIASGEIGSSYLQERAQEMVERGIVDTDQVDFKDFEVAKLDGKTLAQHIKEGNRVGASFLSEESFEKMGFFDDEYIEMLSREAGEDLTREDVADLLREEGVSVLTERYPAIKDDSVIPQNIYLSDTLSGNTIKITAEQQVAMEGDNDGDLVRSSLIRDKHGRDSLMNKLGDHDSVIFKEALAYQYNQAYTVGNYWQEKVEGMVNQSMERSLEDGGFLDITGIEELDKKLTFVEGGRLDTTGLEQHISKWTQIEEDIMEKFEDVKSADDITIETLDEYAKGFDGSKQEDVLDAIETQIRISQFDQANIAKYKKEAIGSANIPNYLLRRYTEAIADEEGWTPEQTRVVQMIANESEQAIISAKKEGQDSLNINKQYNEALQSLIKNKDTEAMTEFLHKHIDPENIEGHIKMYQTEGYFDGDFTHEDIFDMFTESVSSMDKVSYQDLNYLAKRGSSSMGLSAYGLSGSRSTLLEGDESPEAGVLRIMRDAYDMEDMISPDLSHEDKIVGKGLDDFDFGGLAPEESDYSFDDGILNADFEPTTGEQVLGILSNIHKSVSGSFEHLDGAKLAMGAMAAATGIMAVGSFLGNPAQAYDESRIPRESDLYSDSSLMDEDLQEGYPGPQQGYVINVNAGSSSSSREIRSAVQDSMTRDVPLDMTISMNINDNSRQLTEKYIQDMLSSAI